MNKEASILYLDFDGVLHRQLTIQQVRRGQVVALFEFAERLGSALVPYPSVGIVLSTSWVVGHGLQFCLNSLRRPGLCDRVVGATFDPTVMSIGAFADRPRWQQIFDDVERRRPAAWLAVDDDVAGVPPEHNDRFIDVPPHCALGCAAALERLENALEFHFGSHRLATVVDE